MSQRSWFTCSGCFFFRMAALGRSGFLESPGGGLLFAALLVNELAEALADELRIHSFLDGEYASEHQLETLDAVADAELDASPEGQKENVGGGDAVDRRDERGRD